MKYSPQETEAQSEQKNGGIMAPAGLGQAWKIIFKYGQLIGKLATFLGLCITFFYFIESGSIPLDSLSSLGALAVVVAVIALFSAIIFLALWLIPTAAAHLFQDDHPHERSAHWFRRGPDGKDLTQAQRWSRSLIFSSLTGAAVWVWTIAWILPFLFHSEWFRWGSCVVITVAVSIHCWKFSTYPVPASNEHASPGQIPSGITYRLSFFLAYGLMSLFPLTIFLVLLTTSDFRHDGRLFVMWGLLAAGFVVVTLVNSAGLAALQRFKSTQAFTLLAMIGICSLFAIVVGLGSSLRLLDAVMRMSTVRIENVSLALDGKNCATMQMIGVITSRIAGASSSPDGSCLLENVTVVSRVGERWVISCDRSDKATDQAIPRRRRNFRIEASGVQAEINASAEVQKRMKEISLCH
jgi:hypothetical protein